METLRSKTPRGAKHFAALVGSLALGIAGVTAAVSVVGQTPLASGLLDSGPMVWFMVEDRHLGLRTLPRGEDFLAWREKLRCCDHLAAFRLADGALRREGGARPVRIAFATASLLDAVGLAPEVGRSFPPSPSEEDAGAALVSDGLARSLFGAAGRALGRTLTIDGRPLTVVGVMPRDLGSRVMPGESFDVLRPLEVDPAQTLHVVGRLRTGTTVDQARTELAHWGELHRVEAGQEESVHWAVLGPADMLDTATLQMLRVALVSALLLVLVTGSNVGHFLAAEAEARKGEVAIRWALGASRGSLLRWRAGQALAVTVAAGLGGAALASAALEVATSLLPEHLAYLAGAQVDLRSLFVALTVGFLAVLVAGSAPLLARPAHRFREDLGGDRFGDRRRRGWVRVAGQAHVVTTVAASLALAVASLLALRTNLHLGRIDPGFEPKGLQAVEVVLPEGTYRSQAERRAFLDAFGARLASLEAVESVAAATSGPLAMGFHFGDIRFGRDAGDTSAVSGIGAAWVGPGYFRTLGQRVLAGREFVAEDGLPGADALVVSEGVSRRYGSRPADAVGELVRFQEETRRIVGVVVNIRSPGTPQSFGTAKLYWPLARLDTRATLLVRGGDWVLPVAREIAAGLDPDVIVETAPMRERVAEALAGVRFLATLFSLLTALTACVALLGVYGVLSSFAARERRQIALRMAIGASRTEVRWWMLRKALAPSILGVALGIVASYPLCRVFAGQLAGVEADDPTVRVAAGLGLLLTTLLATWRPTSRASRVDSSEILKAAW